MTKTTKEVNSPAPQGKKPRLTLALYALALLASAGLWLWFFISHRCVWDVPMLALWAVVLAVCTLLVARAERRLRAARSTGGPGSAS